MLLLFIHGWSVTNTETYGGLPRALARAGRTAGINLDIRHVYLGRYVSFRDEVTMDDLTRALDYALRQDLPNNANGRRKFSCVTHSTGGPVVREWVERFFGAGELARCPLEHLVMLAPANHGSALAALGKGRIGRLKAWFSGVEPGQQVLDWLCLGSDEQHRLVRAELDYRPEDSGYFPFVLTGESIDRRLYDHLNAYTGERGGDGVVRVASANMNYRMITLVQDDQVIRPRLGATELKIAENRESPAVPLYVVPGVSHSGASMGIMRGIGENDLIHPVVREIIDCLAVTSVADYRALRARFGQRMDAWRQNNPAYCQIVVGVRDDRGRRLDDYDFHLLAGTDYSPGALRDGFFVDRQMNGRSKRLTYFLDHDAMSRVPGGRLGFRVIARPESGGSGDRLAGYTAAEFQAEPSLLDDFICADGTVWLDFVLTRRIDRNVFRFDLSVAEGVDFTRTKSTGAPVP